MPPSKGTGLPRRSRPRTLFDLGVVLTPRVWSPIFAADPELKPRIERIPEATNLLTAPKTYLEGLDRLALSGKQAGWSDPALAEVMSCLLRNTASRFESVELWIRVHRPDDHEAVCDCIEVFPPDDVIILRRLPRQGSQKIVFEASWGLRQKTIILKRLLVKDRLSRELHSHPLENVHPNIIKTYTLRNRSGEDFLVEERLQTVLNDQWRSNGAEQTALLLHDIGSALAYLEGRQLVHGDVKPDNVGLDSGRFILLDFGVCRQAADLVLKTSATGSLRTRAPELLLEEKPQSWQSDVWALGATVCSAASGRFPLVDPTDKVPRISEPEPRAVFESTLRERAGREYSPRIENVISNIPAERLKDLLSKMLSKAPSDRPHSAEVVDMIRKAVPHAVPDHEAPGRSFLSPTEEAKSILAMWSPMGAFEAMPLDRRERLRQRLEELKQRVTGDRMLTAGIQALTEALSG
ncbi:MAG: hypothetical protein FJ291_17325 [Planctomycetes bacterium]|nr:hypothetical protein [Planctomycetota bacterium]